MVITSVIGFVVGAAGVAVWFITIVVVCGDSGESPDKPKFKIF